MSSDLSVKERKSRSSSSEKKAATKKSKPRASKKKIFARFVMVIIASAAIYFCFTFFQVYSSARSDDVTSDTRVDAIVVLGAAQYNGTPSTVLKSRLNHALDLYNQKVAPVIIVTGGNQIGDATTEAATSANYLLNRGVPDENILREVQGVSTYDSLRDTAAFTKDRDINKVVVVTDGFHTKRAELIADEVGLQAIGSPAKDSPITGSSEWKNFFTETARVSVGRIIGFRRVSRDSSIAEFIKSHNNG